MEDPSPIETGKVKQRLLYIDNLRVMIVAFVVMHHLAVTYSAFGGWYYYDAPPLDTLSTIWFAFYLSFQQGYFMGLLFMIAGYFAAGSYDRKGFRGFVGERFKRLVIPALITMVAISPFIGSVELGKPSSGFDLVTFLSGTGVMWFTVALFAFSLAYAIMRRTPRNRAAGSDPKPLTPTVGKAILLVLVIALFAFLIRIVQPIGIDILNMQLCYFASYIVLFGVGIVAYRNDLFARISYRAGKRWLLVGVVLGFVAWFFLVGAAGDVGATAALEGGLTWWSAGYALWESFVAVAMAIGLIAVFREKLDHQSPRAKALAANAFAVYMFHPVIIVPVALLFSPLALYPIAKWLLLCVICVPLCFAATHFGFRRIPLLKDVL